MEAQDISSQNGSHQRSKIFRCTLRGWDIRAQGHYGALTLGRRDSMEQSVQVFELIVLLFVVCFSLKSQ